MKIEDAIVLLPCQSMEELDSDWDSSDANQLLAAWSSMFHPAVIAATQSTVSRGSAVEPPDEFDGRLFVVPKQSRRLLSSGWVERAENAGALVVSDFRSRDDILAIVLKMLDEPLCGVDQELVRDFLAVGFYNLQVELITRQLRYSSNLDAERFEQEMLRAAESMKTSHENEVRDALERAFELLTEAREHYYPVETCLIDLTMAEPTTTGQALRAELSRPTASNLLISGEVLEKMAEANPETLSALKDALSQKKVSIIGGEFCESMISLLPHEAILASFLRGFEVYERHLGQIPVAFGRRRFGLSPILPTIIAKLQFSGAVHFTLDGGRFPSGNQSKIKWAGCGKTFVETLARIPIDVSKHEQFTRLPENLAEVMDLDHAAAIVFAHWPGSASTWYDDLRRIGNYSPVLGKFVSLNDYLEESETSGHLVEYSADQYQSPYLRQAVADGEKDPISRWGRFFSRWTKYEAICGLKSMADLLSGRRLADDSCRDGLVEDIGYMLMRAAGDQHGAAFDELLHTEFGRALKQVSEALPRKNVAEEQGYLVVSPWGFSKNFLVDVSNLNEVPNLNPPVAIVGEGDGKKLVVVDVPPVGTAWIGADQRQPKATASWFWQTKRKKDKPPLAEGLVLQNEFFRVSIDPNMGTIRSIHDYHSRGNRLSQQIALRMSGTRAGQSSQDVWEGDAPNYDYSVMVADDISVTESNSMVGEVVSRGRLVDRHARRLAGYVQRTLVRRGSRVIDLDVEFDIDRQPGDDPWKSYYALRFAWNDAAANLYRSVGLCNVATDAMHLESPYYVDIRSTNTSTTLLTAGLPYHRRFGLRTLDSIAIVKGETARRFRFGIGIDLKHPISHAIDFLSPSSILAEEAAPPFLESSWLLHVNSKNVLITRWEPIFAEGSVIGLRARLLETEGRATRVRLSCFRSFISAKELDLRGTPSDDLQIKDGCVIVQIEAMDWVQVEGRFC